MFDWYIRKAPIKQKLSLAFGAVGAVAVGTTAAIWWQETAIASTLQDPAHRQALASLADLTLVALGIEAAVVVGLAAGFTRCIGTPYVTTSRRTPSSSWAFIAANALSIRFSITC